MRARTECQGSRSLAGSGIVIIGILAGIQGINANLTIDGGAPEYNVVLPAYTASGSNELGYNSSLNFFSMQGITTGNHTATMTVPSWDNMSSVLIFDFAEINTSLVSTAASNPTSNST